MNTERKQYKFTLLTMAPVHIGSGEYYSQKEFIYEDGQYYFPDMGSLYQVIEKRGSKSVETFESFLMKSGNTNSVKKPRLNKFLVENHINERDFGGYKIAETGLEIDPDSNKPKGDLNDIAAFIKDPYNQPYIPGSSLKGAIRTILVNEHFKTDIIPWGSKKHVDFDDIFHHIRVSDSEAIDHSRLMLAQKWDYSTTKNTASSLTLHRESIKPFTKIHFTITAVGEEAISLIDDLGHYAKSYYTRYNEHFLSSCPSEYVQTNIQYPIYLGAGSGFWTKTWIKEANPKRHRNGKTAMKGKGVFKLTKAKNVTFNTKSGKKKLIKNDDDFYEMGKCNFLIKPIE